MMNAYLPSASLQPLPLDASQPDARRHPILRAVATAHRSRPIGGDVVAGRFTLERTIGVGGMACIWLARDVRDGRRVALKVLPDGGDARDVARAAREAAVLVSLHHPAIVRHIDHGFAPGTGHWIAMEWLEGEDLAHRLARTTGGLAIADAVALARGAAEGLGAAHAAGVLHRDIKPANLFLVGRDPSALQVIDFGIARDGINPRLTATGETLGTPGYMAPEQVRGERALTPRVGAEPRPAPAALQHGQAAGHR